MEKIENYRVSYLEPCGNAHWSTIAVLAYITGNYEQGIRYSYNEQNGQFDAEIKVSKYDGGREQGFVFSLFYKCHQANFAVFNPCQYDALCLMMDEKVTDNPDGWGDRQWDKYAEHDEEYEYSQCFECAEYILYRMCILIRKWENNGK